MELTEPLVNGAELPEHPATTTARKIVKFGKVRDAKTNLVLRGGLHQNEVKCLMEGNQMSLGHLLAFVILNGKIYHTRDAVVIEVETDATS